jgi:hypothetical protein
MYPKKKRVLRSKTLMHNYANFAFLAPTISAVQTIEAPFLTLQIPKTM